VGQGLVLDGHVHRVAPPLLDLVHLASVGLLQILENQRMKKVVLFALLGAAGYALYSYGASSKKLPDRPSYAPRTTDFDSEDPRVLATNAMIQVSREMEALGQTATAKVYMEQATNPPPGTVARALQHVADEFDKYGSPALATKLRAVQKQIYTDPIPGQV